MFCTKCGVQLEERENFCSNCGAPTVHCSPALRQKRLVRKVTESKIAGVCAGLAEYLDVDPVMMRLIWVILTVGLPPAGILGYIAAWIIIPKEPLAPVPAPMSVTQT